jgi:hypothetical protein
MMGIINLWKNAWSAMDASTAQWNFAYSIPTETQKLVTGTSASIAIGFYRNRDYS